MARPACVAGESMNARRGKKNVRLLPTSLPKLLFVSMGEPHGKASSVFSWASLSTKNSK